MARGVKGRGGVSESEFEDLQYSDRGDDDDVVRKDDRGHDSHGKEGDTGANRLRNGYTPCQNHNHHHLGRTANESPFCAIWRHS